MDHTEKRRHRRCPASIDITYRSFSDEKPHGAILLDFSRFGMRFISEAPLKPGAVIAIRRVCDTGQVRQNTGVGEHPGLRAPADDPTRTQPCSRELKNMVVAEVRHCRTFLENHRTRHEIGVHFMSPST